MDIAQVVDWIGQLGENEWVPTASSRAGPDRFGLWGAVEAESRSRCARRAAGSTSVAVSSDPRLIPYGCVGLPLALTAAAAWLLGLYLGKIVVAQFIGHLVAASGSIQTGGAVVQFAIGLIVVFLAISLPYVGAVVNILLTLLGFGALLMRAYKSWLGQSAPEPQGA